jgi:hypothetical protein
MVCTDAVQLPKTLQYQIKKNTKIAIHSGRKSSRIHTESIQLLCKFQTKALCNSVFETIFRENEKEKERY